MNTVYMGYSLCKQNLQIQQCSIVGFSFKVDPCVLIQVDVHSWKSTRIDSGSGIQGTRDPRSKLDELGIIYYGKSRRSMYLHWPKAKLGR